MSGECYVGIDLGGMSAKGMSICADNFGEVCRIPTVTDATPREMFDSLAYLAREAAAGIPIAALGVAMPGLVNPARGTNVFSGNLAWSDISVKNELEGRLNVPVQIDNDANVAALGELNYGAAQNARDFIYLAIGTGIGGGIYINGNPLTGAHHAAGEIGHMVLDPQGPACSCGSRGCLEALASGWAILRNTKQALEKEPQSLLLELINHDLTRLDVKAIAQAVAQGDRTATAIIDTALTWLGIGVSNVVNIFNPSLVVLGGGVSLMGDRMLTAVQEAVQQWAMPVQRDSVRIVLSQLGDLAGVYGAVILAQNALRQR